MKKQLMYSALVVIILFFSACSGDDSQESTEPIGNPEQAENILRLYADIHSLDTDYEMLFNGEIIHGTTTPNTTQFHEVVTAQFLTVFRIHTLHATPITIALNSSSMQTQLDDNSCYELKFTTNGEGTAIIDELTKVDCQD